MSSRRKKPRTPLFHGPLGRGLVWICLVSPIVTAPVLQRTFFELPPAVMIQALAGNALPAWGVPLGVYAAYRLVLAPALPVIRTTVGRMAAHLAVSGLAATGVALLIRPAMILFSNAVPPVLGFSTACVVMTWALVLPAALIEREVDRRAATERRSHELREAVLRAELQALRARTQPHFLFNTLNTIASLIPEDQGRAEATVERLANILRYVLQHSGDETVALGDEVWMVEEYLAVQRARFGQRLTYTLELEAGLDGATLPPLSLQLLVENAVMHGVSTRSKGGHVFITIRSRDRMLELIVENEGSEQATNAHRGTGTSLRDLRRRLELSYGGCQQLITRERPDGFTAQLDVPLEFVTDANEAAS